MQHQKYIYWKSIHWCAMRESSIVFRWSISTSLRLSSLGYYNISCLSTCCVCGITSIIIKLFVTIYSYDFILGSHFHLQIEDILHIFNNIRIVLHGWMFVCYYYTYIIRQKRKRKSSILVKTQNDKAIISNGVIGFFYYSLLLVIENR